MRHEPRAEMLVVHLPDLLDPQAVVLGAGVFPQTELAYRFEREASPAALRQNHLSAVQFHAGFERVLLLSVFRDPDVLQPHADDATFLSTRSSTSALNVIFAVIVHQFVPREAREDLHAEVLGLLPQPAAQRPQRDHVVAHVVLLLGQKHVRQPHASAVVQQEEKRLALHGRVERRAPLPPVRKQLLQGGRLEHVSGQHVRPDLRPLVDEADTQVRLHLLCPDGGPQPRRAAAHNHNIVLHHVALDVVVLPCFFGVPVA
mmetsp:Transcript_6161/g.15268  ORF Transcript_6161/g.15268 Transcript_6161/m.15268 type:complete len:259 (+) Transcript_6161:2149-2925(+)